MSAAATRQAAVSDDIVARFSCPIKEPATFLAGGDILMGWFVGDIYVKTKGPEYVFQRIKDLTRSADIAFANFENPMSNCGAFSVLAVLRFSRRGQGPELRGHRRRQPGQ